MNVIRHQAVRKERKLFVLRSTLKLRERLCCRSRLAEHRTTVLDAEREEILSVADVGTVGESLRARHDVTHCATVVPSMALHAGLTEQARPTLSLSGSGTGRADL